MRCHGISDFSQEIVLWGLLFVTIDSLGEILSGS